MTGLRSAQPDAGRAAPAEHQSPAGPAGALLTAVSMTAGRGRAARTVTALARLTPQDRVLDVGCGPGTAARIAGRQCAGVTGVDPAPEMLRLGQWITRWRGPADVTFRSGRAEMLPLPPASVTVAWAISTVHHWADRAAGLAEMARVLAPGGRVLLAERLARPGARGLAAHGLTRDQASQVAAELAAAGFTGVSWGIHQAGRRTLVVLTGRVPAAPD
ncbi:MAG TPA: class I SAM-dependent methyltransferase [Streptosporangiaceae bacterium]|nr:class I SAM-dependent methyltransferase [Streptosporangiaceae bacterium]